MIFCKRIVASSRMIFCLAFLVSLGFGFLGCEKFDRHAGNTAGIQPQATFVVRSMDSIGNLSDTARNRWRFPMLAHYSIRACLEHLDTRELVRGQTFLVEDPLRRILFEVQDPSDANGCIKWEEQIPFNPLARRSYYVPIVRRIHGRGVHQGYREVRFAVNPWALGPQARDQREPFLFLRDTVLPNVFLTSEQNAFQAFSGELSGSSELWIPQVQVRSVRRRDLSDGMLIDLTVQMEPRLRYWNLENSPVFLPLQYAEFEVIAHLVAANVGPRQNQHLILNTEELRTRGVVQDGVLLASIRTNLERRVNSGNLELVVKLIPVGVSIDHVKPFEGIFELGRTTEINQNQWGILSLACREGRSTCQVSEYLKSASNFDSLHREGYAYPNEPLIFSLMRLRFTSVLPGETATRRTVAYTVSTCITDRFSGEPVRDKPFIIEYLGENGEVLAPQVYQKRSNEEGCLSWDSSITHKYYDPEEFFWHRIQIRTETGVVKSLRFALNPWDDKFTFGWDEREFSQEFIRSIQSRKKIRSRFFVDSFEYQTVRFLYNIDPYLELEVKKTVLLTLQPKVLRYSGIVNARRQTEPLRDGIYLLKVAIQKDYLDPAEKGLFVYRDRFQHPYQPNPRDPVNGIPKRRFITTKSTLVRVVDGMIIHPIELSVRDLRLMRIRSNFLIQLETVDERLLQAHNVLGDVLKYDLEKLKREREALSHMSPEERERHLSERAHQRKQHLDVAFFLIRERLKNAPLIQNHFDLEPELLRPIQRALDTNDFTEIRLPGADQVDLNLFVEGDSGLEKRSFVGPVIFLTNSYYDALRATDNLDEARCSQWVNRSPETFYQDYDGGMRWEELALLTQTERNLSSNRLNQAYRFSRYFSALTHLCYAHVDHLIEEEKKQREQYDRWMPLVTSRGQLVKMFQLDYVSLRGERLLQLNDQCRSQNIEDCQEWVTPIFQKAGLEEVLRNRNLLQESVEKTLFLNDQILSKRAGCATLAWTMAHRAEEYRNHIQNRMSAWPSFSRRRFEDLIFRRCSEGISRGNGLVWDEKWHILDVGAFHFRGGLNLNIDARQSFGVDRSQDRHVGFSLTDLAAPISVIGAGAGFLLGGPGGAAVGFGAGLLGNQVAQMLRPFLVTTGQSLAESQGTSVDQSIYLVVQLAKFHVEILDFDRCLHLRLHPDLIERFARFSTDQEFINAVFRRGVMLCSPLKKTSGPRVVEETYVYVTQHFTEGDMLDEADIYNHPWLLSLRGVRDFRTFFQTIEAQEVISFERLGRSLVSRVTRPLSWPTDHLGRVYRTILPSFPGYYTILHRDELLTSYPHQSLDAQDSLRTNWWDNIFQLGRPLPMESEDINAEVRCTLQPDGACRERVLNREPL